MKPSTLVEHVADWHSHLEIDRANRVVRNVALTGGRSRNGYQYTEQALREAAPLYERRPVFLDHAANRSRPQERSTRDLAGSIVNPRFESGRIRGDIRLLDTDSGRTFLALAESNAPGVGMSHVVLAERAGEDGAVSRIHEVISVDAVVFPATTSTFRESLEKVDALPGEHDDESAGTAHPTKSAHPENQEVAEDASQAASTCGVKPAGDETAVLRQQVRQLLTERDELLVTLERQRVHEALERKERATARLLAASGLPDFAMTPMFRRLLAAADDARQRELIEERRAVLEAAARRTPVSCERISEPEAPTSDALFVATLRRRTGSAALCAR